MRHAGFGGSFDFLEADRPGGLAGSRVHHHRHRGITKLQFARETGLGHARVPTMAGAVALHAPISAAFPKRGTLGGAIGPVIDMGQFRKLRGFDKQPAKLDAVRLGEINMGHLLQVITEEGVFGTVG